MTRLRSSFTAEFKLEAYINRLEREQGILNMATALLRADEFTRTRR